MAVVVLDPGHGGTKKVGGSSPNNATGPKGLKEKTATLQVALAAERALLGAGQKVILTRRGDENVGIAERAAVAERANAPAFISIHFNAPGPGKSAQGTETWVGEGHTAVSRRLAEAVQAGVLSVTGHRDRGVKVGAVSGVIDPAKHDPGTANCLCEVSFLSGQADEEERLHDPAYISALGGAIAAAVIAHLRSRGLLAPATVELAVEHEAEDGASARGLGLVEDEGDAAEISTATESPVPASGAERDAVVAAGAAVPFIQPPVRTPPFSDLAAGAAVDDPAQMSLGWRGVRVQGLDVEAAVGRVLTVPAGLLGALGEKRRAVARVTARGVDFRGIAQAEPWRGTGFLVGKNLFLTNHHVLNSPEVARAAVAEFDYEVSSADLAAGAPPVARAARAFKFDPDRLFVTSPVGGGLDYTFVWIEDAASAEFPAIALERASFTAARGEQAFLIHHPRGMLKQASLDDTDVLQILSTVVHYTSDTDYGSSGAPVFDIRGRLIALHHARQGAELELPDGGSTDVVNEGIKIGAIAVDLENKVKARGHDAAMAAKVLAAFRGTDTLTGFFGGLGRRVSGQSGVEAVVDVYRGTDQDVDIGFWNIEWLANRWREPEKLKGAARVIVDLNIDIWALSEVSPAAVRALVGELRTTFGENYDFGLSEPRAAEAKQSTAVIWKRSAVEGGRREWPEDLEPLLRLDSRDPEVSRLEAVDGKIFDRYPGLFRFAIRGRTGFDFFLVPLHLKAMDEGGKRRRLACRVLARVIGAMIERGEDADWVVGGDMNAELASRDFEALQDLSFVPLSAEDERGGGFSYIKSPKSLIDHIYLSSNLTETVDVADFFIVAKERTIDGFVERISDHRPVLARLSLATGRTAVPLAGDDAGIEALVDRLFTRHGLARAPRAAVAGDSPREGVGHRRDLKRAVGVRR